MRGLRRQRLLIWIAGAVGTCAALYAYASVPRPLVFRNVRVFDGEKVLERATVLIRNGKIAEGDIPAGADIVDGDGRTLLPGLIDSHTHHWSTQHMRQALAFGVTTVLDMGTDWKFAWYLRVRARFDPGIADSRSAGNAATSPDGHGTEYGLVLATLQTPAEADAFVAARVREGSDYLKIMYEPGSHWPGQAWSTSLDLPTLRACVAAAHKHGLLAVVHISKLAAAREALEAGADGLAHIFLDTPTEEFAVLAAAKGAFVVPTLTAQAVFLGPPQGPALAADPLVGPFIEPSAKARLLQQFGALQLDGYSMANAARAVAMLAAHGVPIPAGTDASNPGTTQGASLHAELELLVESGLTPVQALAAATSVPAARFHLADRGRIAPGMRADLLLVRGDPTHDIRATRQIDGVWRGGVRFDREKYRRALDETVAAARGAKPTGTVVGTISDFDHGVPSASWGTGWSATNDGGKPTAAIAVEPGGANGSAGALRVTGDVAGLWAGAIFTPGAPRLPAADLSAGDGVAFQARGDGRTYRLVVFAKRLGNMPMVRTFTAGPSWDAHYLTFEELGLDGTDITAIAFCSGGEPGPFAFSIDEVTLVPSRRSAP